MTVEALIEDWKARLLTHGFDLVQTFAASDYNASPTASELEFRLPTFGHQRPLALVVAHSRVLWDVFSRSVRQAPELLSSEHPLDQYTEAVIGALQQRSGTPCLAMYSHQREPVVPIQRIAAVAGLAELSPSHLSVHAELGPWLGLRAVLVFDMDFPVPGGEPRRVASHCARCNRPCLAALANAVAAADRADAWRNWLALRDSCPIGRSARYGEAQIRYHYTKGREWLFASTPNSPEIE